MKRIFAILSVSILLFMGVTAASATMYKPPVTGSLDLDVFAIGGGIDGDVKAIPGGIAGGLSGAGGIAGGDMTGMIFNGTIDGDLNVTAGGVTVTETYKIKPTDVDKGVAVGSISTSAAIIGGSAEISVKPEGYGFGVGHGDIAGLGGQFTLNGSVMVTNPNTMDSNGITGGLAGQGSIGWFEGDVFVMAGGMDMYGYCGYHHRDNKAKASIEAEIIMNGYSYSESGRFIIFGEDSKTEGLYTAVGAGTTIETTVKKREWDHGWGSYANADIYGGYIVVGGAASKTIQFNENGLATAGAQGVYYGAGSLGTNYEGSAIGYTQTTLTTFDGMNGTIASSAAGMTVTSVVSTPKPYHGDSH